MFNSLLLLSILAVYFNIFNLSDMKYKGKKRILYNTIYKRNFSSNIEERDEENIEENIEEKSIEDQNDESMINIEVEDEVEYEVEDEIEDEELNHINHEYDMAIIKIEREYNYNQVSFIKKEKMLVQIEENRINSIEKVNYKYMKENYSFNFMDFSNEMGKWIITTVYTYEKSNK